MAMRPRFQRLVGRLLQQTDAQLLALQQYSPVLRCVPLSGLKRAQVRKAFEDQGRVFPLFQVCALGGRCLRQKCCS